MSTINKLFVLILLLLSISSCKKDTLEAYEVEPVFMNNEEAIAHFKANFIDGQSAWKAILTTKNTGKAYGLYVTLSEKGEVNMLSDLYPDAGNQFTTTSYRLQAHAGNAVLNFSLGSYLDAIFIQQGRHKISADTSYTFRYAIQDTVVLLGNQHGDELKLVRTTVEERNAYNGSALYHSLWNTFNYFNTNRFHSFLYGNGKAVQIMIDQNERSAIAYYVENNKLITTTSYISYGINHINFRTPLLINGKEVRQLYIDPTKTQLYAQEGNQRIDLIGSRVPIIPMHLFLGHGIPSTISAPNPFTYYALEGWSDDAYLAWFNSTMNFFNSPYEAAFMLGDFDFVEDSKQMNISLHFQMGQSNYVAIFPFNYTKTDAGVYTFTPGQLKGDIPEHLNASLIQDYVQDFLRLMIVSRYTLDYYESGDMFLGQFKGVDNPNITFTGFFGTLAE